MTALSRMGESTRSGCAVSALGYLSWGRAGRRRSRLASCSGQARTAARPPGNSRHGGGLFRLLRCPAQSEAGEPLPRVGTPLPGR